MKSLRFGRQFDLADALAGEMMSNGVDNINDYFGLRGCINWQTLQVITLNISIKKKKIFIEFIDVFKTTLDHFFTDMIVLLFC